MKKKKSSIGCLFWIALILLVLVIFLLNRKTISNVIESTGFLNILTKEEESEKKPEVKRKPIEEEAEGETEQEEPEIIEIPLSEEKEETEQREESEEEAPPAVEEEEPGIPQVEESSEEEAQNLRNARLYFIDVDETGSIRLQGVIRPVYYTDAPLTETIQALLRGLLPSELNQELITLIPEDTRLLSATVRDGTAFLNFNEDFKFNTLGSEGLRAQIRQIVYTATEFSSVKNVQILIEGKKQDYLGPEGVFIGKPLNRNSF